MKKVRLELSELFTKMIDFLGVEYSIENDILSVSEDDWNSFEGIYHHGADCGYFNLIYYFDTSKFFLDNKEAVLAFYFELAKDIGEGLLDMIQNFNRLSYYDTKTKKRAHSYTQNEIFKALQCRSWDEICDSGSEDIVFCLVCGIAEELARYIIEADEVENETEKESEVKSC